MNKTKIEWVKNPDGSQGYTWNPITGCLNHINGLCNGGGFPCYAYKSAHRWLKRRYLQNLNIAIQNETTGNPYRDPFYPHFWPERLEEYLGTKPRGIFVCDMSDLFGIGIPEEWTRAVLQKFQAINYDEHRFYLLTKQPQNLIKFSPFPDNCWVGVTACNFDMTNGAIYELDRIDAKVKYLSFEPFLDEIPIPVYGFGVNWVIIGAQTKPYKPPKIEWVREIVEAADRVGIPVFLKDNLKPLLEQAVMNSDHNLYWRDGYYTSPEHPNIDLYLRQEMPKLPKASLGDRD